MNVTQSLFTDSEQNVFPSLPQASLGSLGLPLSFWICSALLACSFLLHGLFFHRALWENTTTPWLMNRYPPRPILGRILFLSPLLVLYVVAAKLRVPQVPHSHMVRWSAQSQPVIASFMGKHSTYCLTLCWAVECWMLAVMTHYQGPQIGCQFLSWVCFSIMHWARRIEDKHSQLNVYTYLFTSSDS